MPLNRNDFIPQSLTTVYTSPSGLTDLRTGLPYYAGGLIVGTYFDLTEAEAQALSVNVLHEGRYRFVKVDSSATYSNIKTGTIGLLSSLANAQAQQPNLITSYDKGLATTLRPVVFLAPLTAAQVTAGAYIFVQELGTANVLAGASITNASKAVGDIIITASGGVVDDPTSQAAITPLTIGYALDLPVVGATGTFRILLDLPTVQG